MVEKNRDGRHIDIDTCPAKSGTAAVKLMRNMVPALQGTLKQAAKDAKGMRQLVYNMGKSMGKTFRPWEATKAGSALAKHAGRLAKVLPFVDVAVDALINYRDEKAQDERQRHLATIRLAVRRAFSEHAAVEGAALAAAIDRFSDEAVGPSVAKIDERKGMIARSRQENAAISQQISDLKSRCSTLRTRIERSVRPIA